MKKYKKTLSAVAALAMMLSLNSVSVLHAEETQPTVLYFRDYENYTSGSELYQGSYYPASVSMGGNGPANSNSTATTGDGIAVDIGKHTGPPPLTLTEPITSGEVYIGFDVAVDKKISPAESYFTVKSSDNKTGRYIRFRPEGAGNGAWEDIANFANLDGNYHRLEVVINLDTKKVSRYLDGAKQGTDTDYGRNNFKSISFMLQDTISKWDNLTIVHYPAECENTYSLTEKSTDEEAGIITVQFDSDTKTITDEKIYTADYPVAFSQDLTKDDFVVEHSAGINAEIESVTKNETIGSYNIKLTHPLTVGTYTVELKEDLVSSIGAVPSNKKITKTIEGTGIKRLTLIDINGKELPFTDSISPEIEKIKFEFTEDVNAAAALANLSVKDEADSSILKDIEATDKTNVALANVSLWGNKEYSISLTDMNQYYIWDFKTAEGKFSLLPIEVFKADGKTPTDLATAQVGDSLKVKLSVFNSIELKEDFTALLTACLYSENSLDGFEYENITIDSSNKIFTKTVDFTVTDNTDLKVKGFLWKALGTRTPIAEEVEAK